MEKMFLDGTQLEIQKTDSGCYYISWDDLEKFFGSEYYLFNKWMVGQTCILEGAYPCDVENYIKGSRRILD